MTWLRKTLESKKEGASIEHQIRPEPRKPDEDTILSTYTIGPVRYYIYRGDDGWPRLTFIEPPPPPHNKLKDLIAGVEEAGNQAERYHLEKAKSGYSHLYPLIIDPHIEEIAVEGPGREVAVIHRHYPSRWISADLRLGEDEADSLAVQLARMAGRMISIAVPIAEGLTRDGHRIAVTFSREASRHGSSFIVRKYPEKPLTMADLVAARILTPLMAAYLWILVEAQSFLIIIGSMGSGKTTLLQSLAGLIPPYHRVVTVEDTPEIKLPNPHWDALVTRPKPPGEEIEEITLEDLLRFALRRRAEHIIVGEVRGREARLLAQAAASGHGSMTTFHADSPEGAILRLRLDPINLPPLFLKVITAFIQVRRIPIYGGKARRRITSITEVVDNEVIPVFEYDPAEDLHTPQTAREVLERSRRIHEAWMKLGIPSSSLEAELEERARVLEGAVGLPPEEVYTRITSYYQDKYGV